MNRLAVHAGAFLLAGAVTTAGLAGIGVLAGPGPSAGAPVWILPTVDVTAVRERGADARRDTRQRADEGAERGWSARGLATNRERSCRC